MAALTITARTTGPYDAGRYDNNVKCKTIAGAGADATTVAAAVASQQHIITGGHLSSDIATRVDILSASTVIGSMQFVAAGTLPIPPVWTEPNELLALDKSEAVAVLSGSIEYVTLAAGQYCGILA